MGFQIWDGASGRVGWLRLFRVGRFRCSYEGVSSRIGLSLDVWKGLRGGLFKISNLGWSVGKGWLGFAISVPAMKGFPAATVGKVWAFRWMFGRGYGEGCLRFQIWDGASGRVG